MDTIVTVFLATVPLTLIVVTLNVLRFEVTKSSKNLLEEADHRRKGSDTQRFYF